MSSHDLVTLTLDFGYIEVIGDCDGIEGDGDFSFSRTPWMSYEPREVLRHILAEADFLVEVRSMARMRDRLIHDYFGVDVDIVWGVLQRNIPA